MAKKIAILGSKGGPGKTTLSHMLAHGFGLLNIASVILVTDQGRESLSEIGRRYLPCDARNPHNFESIMNRIDNDDMKDTIVIMDGGGNRPRVDDVLYSLADVTLIPFRESAEDLRTAKKDLQRLPEAYAVPCAWPTNKWQRSAADKLAKEMLEGFQERILEPINSISSSKLLLLDTVPAELPSELNNACRAAAWLVLDMPWAKGVKKLAEKSS